MSAKNKQELIELATKEFAKLEAMIASIDAKTAGCACADGISIKDTIAHRAHWVDLLLKWQADGKAGLPVQTPAPGYKWTELKAYNAAVRKDAQALDWDQAREGLAAAHGRLMEMIGSIDNTVLYGERLYDWMNDWTLGRWAEASGPSHYRSARKFIRKLLREQAET